MEIAHAHPGRRVALALALVTLVALALLVAFGAVPQPASALIGYQHGGTSCGSCHTGSSYGDPVLDASCTTCHTGGFTTPAGSGFTCASASGCHSPDQDMTTVQTAAGCSTGAAGAACHNGPAHVGSTVKTCTSCHGVVASATAPGQSNHHVASPKITALLTIKVATSVKVRKTIKATGLARAVTPTYKVKVLIQKKNSRGKWVKITTKSAAPKATTSAWSVSYKPLKKGSYRMQASVPAATGAVGSVAAAKSVYKNFRVK